MANGRSLFPGFSRENLGQSGRAVWYVNTTTGDKFSRHTFETKIRKIPDSRIRSHPDKLTKQQLKAIATDKQRINTLKIAAKTGTKPPKSIRDTLVRNAKKISVEPKIKNIGVPPPPKLPPEPPKFPIPPIFDVEIKEFFKSRTRHTIVSFDNLDDMEYIVSEFRKNSYGVMYRGVNINGWYSTDVVYIPDEDTSEIVRQLLAMMHAVEMRYKNRKVELTAQEEDLEDTLPDTHELVFISDL